MAGVGPEHAASDRPVTLRHGNISKKSETGLTRYGYELEVYAVG